MRTAGVEERGNPECRSRLTPAAKQDHPQDHCEFGEHGWIDEDVNVLTAIMNMTQQVMDGRG
jgi:hypothetical protein